MVIPSSGSLDRGRVRLDGSALDPEIDMFARAGCGAVAVNVWGGMSSAPSMALFPLQLAGKGVCALLMALMQLDPGEIEFVSDCQMV